jgi:hypothetical protein
MKSEDIKEEESFDNFDAIEKRTTDKDKSGTSTARRKATVEKNRTQELKTLSGKNSHRSKTMSSSIFGQAKFKGLD